MPTLTSADGTTIGYDSSGTGPPIILVDGALCDRRGPMRPVAERLRTRFTVLTYDRRGRGESTDTQPYSVDREIEDLRVMHSTWATLFYYEPEPSLAKLKGMQSVGEANLPLVWKHRSGRKSLILGCTAHRVEGVDPMKSAELLVGLREWATSEPFSFSHEWAVGDMVIWDNTGTMHRAEHYDPACGRLMVRTKLQGEEPFE